MAPPSFQLQSWVSLYAEFSFNGTKLASGTASFVDESGKLYLITNWHNVSGRDVVDGSVRHPQGGTPNEIVVWCRAQTTLNAWEAKVMPLLDDSNNPLWFEHPAHGRIVDVVALPVEVDEMAGFVVAGNGVDGTELKISIAPSQSVSIIGFPFGLTGGGYLPIWSNGTIATEPDVAMERLPLLLVDSRTRAGQSGSPVIAQRQGSVVLEDGSIEFHAVPVSRFVGIYSGRVNASSDLGLVWRASAVREIIHGAMRGKDPQLAEPVPPLFEGHRTQAGRFRPSSLKP